MNRVAFCRLARQLANPWSFAAAYPRLMARIRSRLIPIKFSAQDIVTVYELAEESHRLAERRKHVESILRIALTHADSALVPGRYEIVDSVEPGAEGAFPRSFDILGEDGLYGDIVLRRKSSYVGVLVSCSEAYRLRHYRGRHITLTRRQRLL